MARVLITGFEASPPTATDINSPDGYVFAGTAGTLNTTTKKSGGSSLQLVAGATTAFANIPRTNATDSVSIAFWFRRTGTNSGTEPEVGIYGTAIQARVAISSTGTVTAYGGATGTTSTSSAIPVDTWAHIELRVNVTSTTGGTIRLFVDTVEIGSATAATWTAQTGTVFSLRMSAYATTGTVLYDDLVVDSVVSTTALAIGASQLILVKPTSDVSIGGWRGGIDSTTNLFDAVDNFPPIGTAGESNVTQIENAVNGGGGPYASTSSTFASLGAIGPIKSIRVVACHGEDVATGTKTGYVNAATGILDTDNATTPTFNYGGPVSGQLGTYPTGWYWTHMCSDAGSTQSTHSVSFWAYKTDTGTRTASISAIGLYAEYNPLVQSVGTSNSTSTVTSALPPIVKQSAGAIGITGTTVTLNDIVVGNILVALLNDQVVGEADGATAIPAGWVGNNGWSYDIGANVTESGFIAVKKATSTSESLTIGDRASYQIALVELDISAGSNSVTLVSADIGITASSNPDLSTTAIGTPDNASNIVILARLTAGYGSFFPDPGNNTFIGGSNLVVDAANPRGSTAAAESYVSRGNI